MSKSAFRKAYLQRRNKVPLHYRQEAALKAADVFTQLPLFKQNKHFACYLSVKDEFDAARIIEAIWQAKKSCYLPILSPSTNQIEKSLLFVRYQYGDPLHLNRYSILEPVNTANQIPAEHLDVVLTPLIAFDLKGNRLGTGGGYYDRTFAFLHAGGITKPHMLGLAYAEQQADLLPHEKWDVPLDGVVTEKGFISYQNK